MQRRERGDWGVVCASCRRIYEVMIPVMRRMRDVVGVEDEVCFSLEGGEVRAKSSRLSDARPLWVAKRTNL